MLANGWDETLAKFKPGVLQKEEYCTIGEFLADVEARSHLRPITARRYATNLRRIVSDLANVEAGLKGKAKTAKYDHVNGGRQAWRAKIESQRLDILTTDALIAWRNAFVARAGSDPIKRKSAERSAVTNLRGARSLFTKEILMVLKVKVPPNPFTAMKIKTPGPRRYRSDVSPEWLLVEAERELRTADPQQYLAMFLCLWAGLRRKEADLLMWSEVDFENCQIHVRRTRYFEPKTEESQRSVDMLPEAMDVIRAFKQGSTSEFVLEGEDPYPEATYDYYRCDATWRRLHAWLRGKGITEQKAIHALRKESGSLVASTFGIEAARQHLGHRDIHTTSAHYVTKKRRIEVRLPIGKTELKVLPSSGAAEQA